MKIHNVKQGSEEWHRLRRDIPRTATRSAAVLGKSPYITQRKLVDVIKNGVPEASYNNPAMRKGTKYEAAGRASFEKMFEVLGEPLTISQGPYLASLDWVTIDFLFHCDIKVPWAGKNSERWLLAEKGQASEHDIIQANHQMMILGTEYCYFYIYDPETDEGIPVKIKRDNSLILTIKERWEDFNDKYLAGNETPPAEKNEADLREDDRWEQLAQRYLEFKREMEIAKLNMDTVKELLIKESDGKNIVGCGIRLVHYSRQGSIQYKTIPELKNVDVEQFRAEPIIQTRISEVG